MRGYSRAVLTALLLFLAATPRGEADVDWQLAALRTWLSSASRSPGENAEAPLAGAVELGPESAKYQEVVALVRRRCALTNERPAEVPLGHLWEADLDGDGTAERFFTGGCSPAPYFVALQSRPSGWVVWQEGSGALIQVLRHGDEVIFVTARDGYGVERESALTLISIAGWRREFRIVGSELEHQFETRALPAKGETCALQTTALLRSEARVRDAPEESGMGFDFPGNLLQTLAAGSVGLSLGSRGSFRLCAFAASAPAEDVLKSMRTAALRTLTPMPSTLMVGWVPERALRRAR